MNSSYHLAATMIMARITIAIANHHNAFLGIKFIYKTSVIKIPINVFVKKTY